MKIGISLIIFEDGESGVGEEKDENQIEREGKKKEREEMARRRREMKSLPSFLLREGLMPIYLLTLLVLQTL